MFGLNPESADLMVLLGRVAGYINLFLLLAVAVTFLYLGYASLRGDAYPDMIENSPERKKAMDWLGPWLIPLGIIMILAIWRIFELLQANSRLSGIVGIAAFLKALIL